MNTIWFYIKIYFFLEYIQFIKSVIFNQIFDIKLTKYSAGLQSVSGDDYN